MPVVIVERIAGRPRDTHLSNIDSSLRKRMFDFVFPLDIIKNLIATYLSLSSHTARI